MTKREKVAKWLLAYVRNFVAPTLPVPDVVPKESQYWNDADELLALLSPGEEEVALLRRAVESLKEVSRVKNKLLDLPPLPSPGYHPKSLIGEIEQFLTYAAQKEEHDG